MFGVVRMGKGKIGPASDAGSEGAAAARLMQVRE